MEKQLNPSRESIALYAAARSRSGNQGGGGGSDSEGEGEGEGEGGGVSTFDIGGDDPGQETVGEEDEADEEGHRRWGQAEDRDSESTTLYLDGEHGSVGGRGGPARGGLSEVGPGGGEGGEQGQGKEPGWFTKLVKKAEVSTKDYSKGRRLVLKGY